MKRQTRIPWVGMVLCIGLFAVWPASAREPRGEAGRRVSRATPDTVLARIGEHRLVTRRAFDEAWGRTGWPADSITPEARRRFLSFLVDREVLRARAMRERWHWTAAESAGYRALRDHLVLSAALEKELAALASRLAARGQPVPDAAELGVALRDSVLAGAQVVFDEALVQRLAAAWSRLPRPTADSSAAAQVRLLSELPVLAPGDDTLHVARSRLGGYDARDLLDAWRRLGVAYRPRVETPGQIEDLVRNGLFERALRERAAREGWEDLPQIAARLVAAREEIAVAHLLERDVLGIGEPTAAALRETYGRTAERWRLPTRVRGLELSLATRGEAERWALDLRDPARAESLAAQARRRGLDFAAELTAARDSARFARALAAGVGSVLGPDGAENAWRVFRIEAVLPGRPLTLDEVRTSLVRLWAAEETQRRLERACAGWRAQEFVEIREELLSGGRELPAAGHAGP